MKMEAERARRERNAVIRRMTVTIILLVMVERLKAAEPADLKTFASQENYVVEGVPIVLKQRPGEVMVKLGPGFRPTDDAGTLTAANGAKFDQEREVKVRFGIYRMQSADPVDEAASKEAIDSLNQDSNIEFAYPVYVNPASGLRHFLNDEVVFRLKAPLDPSQTDLSGSFNLELIDTLSAKENIYVFKLLQPKNFNPFRVCHALLQRPEVVWAEPNRAQTESRR